MHKCVLHIVPVNLFKSLLNVHINKYINMNMSAQDMMTSYAPTYGLDPRDNVPSNGSELSAILHHSMEEAKAKEQSLEGLLGTQGRFEQINYDNMMFSLGN